MSGHVRTLANIQVSNVNETKRIIMNRMSMFRLPEADQLELIEKPSSGDGGGVGHVSRQVGRKKRGNPNERRKHCAFTVYFTPITNC